MRIKEVIVVEGKNDTNVLKSYFECDTIETHGTHLSEKTLGLIAHAQKVRGVIIFTDPDYPGDRIRREINEKIKGCKNAFIEKEKSKTSKKVGVEHANKKDLEESLSSCVTFEKESQSTLCMQDFFELNIAGSSDSSTLRKKIGKELKIGESNAKTLLKRCKMIGITKEALNEIIKKIK